MIPESHAKWMIGCLLRNRREKLGLAEGNALLLLSLWPRLSAKDLREAMGIHAPAVTELGERMLRRGLVTRTPNGNDRRSHILELTDKGRETAERIFGKTPT